MRGQVLSYDDTAGTGLISGDDGVRYGFARSDLQRLVPIRPGTVVDFVPVDGVATEIFVVQPTAASPATATGIGGTGVQSFDWRDLFLNPNGRIAQRDFWIGFAVLFVANLVLGWLPLIGFLISLALFYAWVCVASKRLHDMGRSGWLVAIPVALAVLAMLMATGAALGGMATAGFDGGIGMAAGMGLAGLIGILAFLANIALVIWLGITAGEPGDNRFGPPPTPRVVF